MPSVRHRVSLLHKGGFLIYGAAGADIPSRIQNPSSAIQLPILAALHAGRPTLFAHTIHDLKGFVKGESDHFFPIPRSADRKDFHGINRPQSYGSTAQLGLRVSVVFLPHFLPDCAVLPYIIPNRRVRRPGMPGDWGNPVRGFRFP